MDPASKVCLKKHRESTGNENWTTSIQRTSIYLTFLSSSKYLCGFFCCQLSAKKPFGKHLKSEFLLDPDTIFLNHGSYGAAPKCVFEARSMLLKEQEHNLNSWFTGSVRNDHHKENISAVSTFLCSKEENLVFVENATTGINNVIKSLNLTARDAILINTFTYGAVVLTCQETAKRTGSKLIKLDIVAPISSKKSIIEMYETVLQNHPNIKCAVIDHISSESVTLYPIVELIQVCHRYDVLVCIDGAHAPGQVINLNLEVLGEQGLDFYVGNLHKWAYTCRGCAILWVHPRHHYLIRPVVTSFQSLYPVDDFRSYFVYNGTQDRTSLYTSKSALDFIAKLGGMDAIVQYNSTLLNLAVDYLAALWNTQKCPLTEDMEAPCMRLVKVPNLTKCSMKDLKHVLETKYNIVSSVVNSYKTYWVRLSANIYNSFEDYKKLGNAVCDLM